MAFVSDITQRKQIETNLGEERNFITNVLDIVAAMIVVSDSKGRIVRFNRACEALSGYSFEEVRGKYFWDFLLIPEEMEPVKEVFSNLLTQHGLNQFENFWVTKSGERRLISWSGTVLQDEKGMVTDVIWTGIDITVQREVRRALERNQEDLRELSA